MGVRYKGSQGQTERTVELQEETEDTTVSFLKTTPRYFSPYSVYVS
jgi:hypothetical protein